MTPALISLLIQLAPYMEQVLAELLKLLINKLQVDNNTNLFHQQSLKIVSGINQDHPTWSPDQKTQYANDAIKILAQHMGIQL